MLIERVFLIGGALLLGIGVAFAASLIALGVPVAIAAFPVVPVMAVLGAFFLYAASAARRSRRRLLAIGDPAEPTDRRS